MRAFWRHRQTRIPPKGETHPRPPRPEGVGGDWERRANARRQGRKYKDDQQVHQIKQPTIQTNNIYPTSRRVANKSKCYEFASRKKQRKNTNSPSNAPSNLYSVAHMPSGKGSCHEANLPSAHLLPWSEGALSLLPPRAFKLLSEVWHLAVQHRLQRDRIVLGRLLDPHALVSSLSSPKVQIGGNQPDKISIRGEEITDHSLVSGAHSPGAPDSTHELGSPPHSRGRASPREAYPWL